MTDRLSIGILLGIEFRWVVFHFKPGFVSDLDNTRVVTIDPLLDLRIAARQPEVRPSISQSMLFTEKPTWIRIRRFVSSQRKTPA